MKTYTGEPMSVLGYLEVQAKYGEQEKDLHLFVVSGNGPSLLGRNWLVHFRLDWAKIARISTADPPHSLNTLTTKHVPVFEDKLGTITPFKAKLHIQSDAVPRFCKPCSVPYATEKAIKEELDHLEADGILKKVSYAERAAQIVAAPKIYGKIRICGDYKVTVNPVLQVDQYPLPKPETLAVSKKFSTLDLSQAYLQLLIDDESSKLVTVNTHRGLTNTLVYHSASHQPPHCFRKRWTPFFKVSPM
jgi:hypothetical protein